MTPMLQPDVRIHACVDCAALKHEQGRIHSHSDEQFRATSHLDQTAVEDLLLLAIQAKVLGAADDGDDQVGLFRLVHLPVVDHQVVHQVNVGSIYTKH